MELDIRNQKTLILGLQGSGKTFFSKWLVKKNNYKVLVFSPHYHDFKDEPDNFYFYKGFGKSQIEKFFTYAKALCKKGIIDGVLVDEFDILFKNNSDVGDVATDVFANHRHYNMFIMGVSRRPQDIPAYFVESCMFILSFSMQGDNVKKKFNGIYSGFGDMVLNLNYESREFILKRIGQPPVKHEKVNVN